MSRTIPHLLEPYISLPDEASLVVLTSVLGASTNWLVLRHLHSLLKPASQSQSHSQSYAPPSATTTYSPRQAVPGRTPPGFGNAVTNSANPHNGGEDQDGEEDVAVLLVSFLRDFSFWREHLARLGIDLEAVARRGKFGYVEGLNGGLFTGSPAGTGPQQRQGQMQGTTPAWKRTLISSLPGDVARVVTEGVEQLKRGGSGPGGDGKGREKKVVLVIDGLDFLLAASDPSSTETGTAMALKDMLMDLREKTHAAIITLAADDPLIKEQETTLEKQHAWCALSLAHEADTVLSLRLLDTGAAKDVSGVIRITHGRARTDNHEYLYHVGGDGGVRVFERGQ